MAPSYIESVAASPTAPNLHQTKAWRLILTTKTTGESPESDIISYFIDITLRTLKWCIYKQPQEIMVNLHIRWHFVDIRGKILRFSPLEATVFVMENVAASTYIQNIILTYIRLTYFIFCSINYFTLYYKIFWK